MATRFYLKDLAAGEPKNNVNINAATHSMTTSLGGGQDATGSGGSCSGEMG